MKVTITLDSILNLRFMNLNLLSRMIKSQNDKFQVCGKGTNRYNDLFVFIVERLIPGGRINNGQALVSQVTIPTLVQPTPIRTTMLQSILRMKNSEF